MTEIRHLGIASRAVVSALLGFAITFVFAMVALAGGVYRGPWTHYCWWPLAPGEKFAEATNTLGTGPEQFFPVIWANAAFYSLLVFVVWGLLQRRRRQPTASVRP